MKKIFLVLILISSLAADDMTITANVDKTVVSTNDQILLQVNVSGSGTPALKEPSINDFNIYKGGQSTSSSVSIVNGQISSSITIIYNYALTPKAVGKFTIPSFSVDYKGKTFKTDPIQVEVVKGNAPAKTSNPSAPGVSPQKATSSNNIFVQVTLDKYKVYVNEPVIMTFSFYNKLRLLSQPHQFSAPDTTGFWKEDLPPQINTVSNGYNVIELKTLLFPTASGDYTIGKASLVCDVPSNGNQDDFFDGFFSRGQSIKLESKPVSITVLPLPAEGKPADFSGNVGRYTLKTNVDKKDLKTNDAVTLTVKISGIGNIKSIAEPKLIISDEFKKYETISDLNINKDNYEFKGSKTFKTVLVPRKAGKLVIPAVSYSYFDYADRKYKTISSDPVTLNVAQGPNDEINYSNSANLPMQEGVKVFGTDIRYIKQPAKFSFASEPFYRSPFYIFLSLIPLLAFLFIVFYKKMQVVRAKNSVVFKTSQAYSSSKKKVNQLFKTIKQGKKEEALSSMEDIFAGYIGDKINRSAAGLSIEEIESILSVKIKDAGLVESAAELFDELQFLRYAPSGKDPFDLNKTATSIKEMIDRLEKAGL